MGWEWFYVGNRLQEIQACQVSANTLVTVYHGTRLDSYTVYGEFVSPVTVYNGFVSLDELQRKKAPQLHFTMESFRLMVTIYGGILTATVINILGSFS